MAAAADAQRALAGAEWPAAAGVRVRMGLHTGVARLGGDDYVGLDVNRAARICGLGHGGQVLLSDATRALTADDLPAGVSVRSLGPHRLRDLDRPEPLHQLVIEGLPFGLPAARRGRQPGREPAESADQLRRARPRARDAGSPARRVCARHADGTRRRGQDPPCHRDRRVAVPRTSPTGRGSCASRRSRIPSLVLNAIAGTFGLVESPQTTPIERLQAFLAGRSILLVLDNFEHLMPAAAAYPRAARARRARRARSS